MRSIVMIVYVVIGVAVAAARGYLGDVGSIGDIVNLLLAVLLWPLVLLGVEFNLNIGGGNGGNKKGALSLGPLAYARSWLGPRRRRNQAFAEWLEAKGRSTSVAHISRRNCRGFIDNLLKTRKPATAHDRRH